MLCAASQFYKVTRCKRPYHGVKTCVKVLDKSLLFHGFSDTFVATSYHSLCVSMADCSELDVLAKSDGQDETIIQALKHKDFPYFGVQFHPESICSEHGMLLIENFMQISRLTTNKVPLNEWIYGLNSLPDFQKGENEGVEVSSSSVLTLVTSMDFDPSQSPVLFKFIDQKNVHNGVSSCWLDSSREDSRSRFSVISYSRDQTDIYYNVVDRSVVTVHNGKEIKTHLSETDGSIFTFLSNFLQKYEHMGRHHFSIDDEIVGALEDDMDFNFECGLFGFFGYGCRFDCEISQNSSHAKSKDSMVPDACFSFVDRLFVVDNLRQKLYFLCLANSNDSHDQILVQRKRFTGFLEDFHAFYNSETPIERNAVKRGQMISHSKDNHRESYVEAISKCKEYITDGESYELCLTCNWKYVLEDVDLKPFGAYETIRANNPAPYGSFLHFRRGPNENVLMASSPERFIKIDSSGKISMKPIKGTIKRGRTEAEDQEFKQQLQNSEKDFSENLMIVDLIRNDLNAICIPGTVQVPNLMKIETYETVHQLVTEVVGTARNWQNEGSDPFLVLKSCFPPGSMTGAPKKRSCELLQALESKLNYGEDRGPYSGIHGFVGLNRASDFSVIIRAACLSKTHDGVTEISVGAGGAITYLSDPEDEYNEMVLKANSVVPSLLDYYGEHLKPKE